MRKEYVKMGATSKQEAYGSYCYDIVMQQFSHGIKGLNDNESGVKINGWSPNNLRRIIISAEGVILQYHTTSGGAKNTTISEEVRYINRGSGSKMELASRVYKCYETAKVQNQSDEYKSIMGILTGKRICSSIEEIIYLTEPMNVNGVNISLPSLELDYGGLVGRKRTQGLVGKELVNEISKRFKRLYAVTFLKLNLDKFTRLNNFGANSKKPLYHFADDEFYKQYTSQQYYFNKEDWFRHTSLRPQYYSLDEKDGALDRHFTKIKEDMESQLKSAELEKRKLNLNKAGEEAIQTYKAGFKVTSELMFKVYRFMKYVQVSKSYRSPVITQDIIDHAQWGVLTKVEGTLYLNDDMLGDIDHTVKKCMGNFGATLSEEKKTGQEAIDNNFPIIRKMYDSLQEFCQLMKTDMEEAERQWGNEELFRLVKKKYKGKLEDEKDYLDYIEYVCDFFVKEG